VGYPFHGGFKDHANNMMSISMPAGLKAFISDMRAVFHRDSVEGELAEELRFHIEERTQENIASGMNAAEARQDTVRRFGNFETVREDCRTIRGSLLIETALQDVLYGARTFLRNRTFTFVAVLTLALGMGASTSIFSVVYAVLLRPLPYRDSNHLVWVTNFLPNFNAEIATGGDFLEWSKQKQVFESVAAYSENAVNLTSVAIPRRLSAGLVSASFFPLLGVRPFVGRSFSQAEDKPGGARVVMLGFDLWQHEFGSDRREVGKSVTLDGRNYTVIGVVPRHFSIFDKRDIWMPLALDPAIELARERMTLVYVIARLRQGISLTRAHGDLTTVANRLGREYPQGFRGVQVRLIPLHERLVSKVRLSLLVLLGAVGFVLLIACLNVANLLVARGATREKEMAVRGALGASRGRMIRQLLTESLLLGFTGGGAGLLIAIGGMHFLTALVPRGVPGAQAVHLDLGILVFALGLPVVTALVFGLVPAQITTRLNLGSFLKEAAETYHRPIRLFRLSDGLIVLEIALALVLLAGAGLMIRSFLSLRDVNRGFRARHVLTMAVQLPSSRYQQPAKQAAFLKDVLLRIERLPGVESAAVTSVREPIPAPSGSWLTVAPAGRRAHRGNKDREPGLLPRNGHLASRGPVLHLERYGGELRNDRRQR
jgi:predicted permease